MPDIQTAAPPAPSRPDRPVSSKVVLSNGLETAKRVPTRPPLYMQAKNLHQPSTAELFSSSDSELPPTFYRKTLLLSQSGYQASQSYQNLFKPRSFSDSHSSLQPSFDYSALHLAESSDKPHPNRAKKHSKYDFADSNYLTSCTVGPLQPTIPVLAPHLVNRSRTGSDTSVRAQNAHSRTGGWKSGYRRISMGPLVPLLGMKQNSIEQTEQEENSTQKPPIDIIEDGDTSRPRSVRFDSNPYVSTQAEIESDEVTLARRANICNETNQHPLRRSLILTEKPSFDLNCSKEEVDLANFLDGTRCLQFDSGRLKKYQSYDIVGCVASSDYGFILIAEEAGNPNQAVPKVQQSKSKGARLQESTKKKIYIKMISRASEAYKAIGRYVNPENTELVQMQKGKKHLPEYIDHYWEEDYLVIFSKTHGKRRHSINPFSDAYYDVQWIYYFNQVA